MSTQNRVQLPSAISSKLRSIRLRSTLLALTRAVLVGLAALLTGMVLAMAADWAFTLFDARARTALTAAALLASAGALLALGVRGWLEARRWLRAAESADRRTPQLEERWRTVASFALNGARPSSPAAKAMLQQVTSESIALERLVDPGRAAPVQSLRRGVLAAGASLLLLTAFLLSDWERTSVLLRRFWSPTADITATQIRDITGDLRTPRGETVELQAGLGGLIPHVAMLTVRDDSGVEEQTELTPEDGVCLYALRADSSFRYRIHAGDDRSAWHRVRVLQHPELAETRLRVMAPSYVNRPPVEKSLLPSRLKVVQGSRLILEMKPAAPLREFALEFHHGDDSETPPERVLLRAEPDGWHRFELTLVEDVALQLALTSTDGLTDRNGPRCRIEILEDRAPVARVISPSNEMAVATDDVLDIRFEAHDDHGIATAELVVYDETATAAGEEPRVLRVEQIPLGDQALQRHVAGQVQLDLKELELPEGTNISYAIRVTDNRELTESAENRIAQANSREEIDEQLAQRSAAASDELLPETEIAEVSPEEALEKMADGVADASPRGAEEPAATETDTEGEPGKPSETGSEKESAPKNVANAEPSAPSDADPEADAAQPNETASKIASTEGTPSVGTPSLSQAEKASPQERPAAGDASSQPATRETETPAAAAAAAGTEAERAEDDLAQSPEAPEPDDVGAMEEPGDSAGEASQAAAAASLARGGQRSESGQNAETQRLRLRIAARLTAVAAALDEAEFNDDVRSQVVAIERLLAAAEADLRRLEERLVADADRSEQFRRIDQQLGKVEEAITRLHETTEETEFIFVGLQMADIGRSHVTPARDRVFVGIREPLGSSGESAAALNHVIRARELLAALLKRYDAVVRERELKRELDESITMYEVYVEKMQQLLREARQNRNPLERKMAVVEVDQEYLDRFAEVQTLRREMLQELAQMLRSDPRLTSRYFDLIRRRRSSLRDQLGELAERQDEISAELSGWLAVEEDQRADVWMLVTETRLYAATDLAQAAAQLNERIRQQLPLLLEQNRGNAERLLSLSEEADLQARRIALDGNALLEAAGSAEDAIGLEENARALVHTLEELQAALDQLQFDHDSDEETTGYVGARQQEARVVQNSADDWLQTTAAIREASYAALAQIDHRKHSIATELLRTEMLNLATSLEGEFNQIEAAEVPAEILDLVRELQRTMESIVMHQRAATYALQREQIERGEELSQATVAGFARAEELFDELRRKVIAALDEYELPDPNIADLQDPTLDEFLARLEREPDLEAQLGLPGRPRNIRVTAELSPETQSDGQLLASSGEGAMRRAREAMQREPVLQPRPTEKPETELTEEERAQRQRQQEMEEKLQQALAAIEAQRSDPATSDEQRAELAELQRKLERLQDQLGSQTPEARAWQERAEADAAAAALAALAGGERLRDEQWNRLLSTLDDGLWQVQGRTPPERYRKAIEEYQDRLRQLTGASSSGEAP